MMDYKEMAEIVKARGDAIIEQKAARSRRIKRISVIASELAATAAAVFCILHNSYISKAPPVDPDETITICVTTSESTSAAAATTVTVSGKTGKTTDIPVMTTKTEANTAIASSAVSRSSSDVSTTAAASAAKENKTSSAASVPAVSDNSTAPTASAVREPVTTIALIPENEEAIRMKVENIKRYLAVISAAALSSGVSQSGSAADIAYDPLPLSSDNAFYLYLMNNEDKVDFDGDGRFSGFDTYALFTYVNERSSVPEKTVERCETAGDINDDGVIDINDCSLMLDHWAANYLSDALDKYMDGVSEKKILFEGEERESYDVYADSVKNISSKCTPEEREKYLCEYVHESYTYGSESNVMSYIEKIYDITFHNYYQFCERYGDFMNSEFAKKAGKMGLSIDVNKDGNIDMKDAYDVYLYNMSLPFRDERRSTTYFDQFHYYNGESTLVDLIGLEQAELEKLNCTCEPLYDLASRYTMSEDGVMKMIILDIMRSTEVTFRTILSPYYISYRGDLEIDGGPVTTPFLWYITDLIYNYFEVPMQSDTEKFEKSMQLDREYIENSELMRGLFLETQNNFRSGKTPDVLDLNRDGKVDAYDSYVASICFSDLCNGITEETSDLPNYILDYVNNYLDIDDDGLAGDLVDLTIVSLVINDDIESLTDYEKDLYWLELIEQKETETKDIVSFLPYMAAIFDNKQSGDVDLDGSVTAADATEVLVYYADKSVNAEISGVTESKMQHLADMNDDGLIDSSDATQILCEYAENSVK